MLRQRQGQGQGQRQRQGQNQQPQQRQNQGPQPHQPQAAGRAAQVNYAAAPPGPFAPGIYANATQTNLSLNAQNAIRQEDQRRQRNGGRALSNSGQLSIALNVDGGVPNPRNAGVRTQAHHIGPSGDGVIQDIYRNLGMNPNATFNGVRLPERETDDTGDATVHYGSHTAESTAAFNEGIFRALDRVPNNLPPRQYQREAQRVVVEQVGRTRNVLLTRQVPLNGRNDAEWNPATGRPYTAREIYEEEGLYGPPQPPQ